MKSLPLKVFAGASMILAMFSFTGCGESDPHSVYNFQLDDISQVTTNLVTEVDVTLKATDIRDEGYEHVLIKIDATNKDNLEIKATDSQSLEWDVVQVGMWGPPEGFALSNDYNQTTTFKVKAKADGEYMVTFNLVDLDNDDNVLASRTITFTAVSQ